MGVISDLIASSLVGERSAAMAKIAQDAEVGSCEECGKTIPVGDKMCKACAEKKAQSETRAFSSSAASENSPATDTQEKVSSDYERVYKLANALDYIVANPQFINWGAVSKLAESVSGQMPENDENQGIEKTPNPPKGSTVHAIPMNPLTSAGTLRNDGKSDTPPGGKLVERIKQAVAKRAQGPATNQNILPEDRPPQVQKSTEVPAQVKALENPGKAQNLDAVPKKQVGDLLSEPMKSTQQDEAVQDMLGNPPQDTVPAKTASASSLIAKLASSQCTCGGQGTCGACQIKLAAERRSSSTRSALKSLLQ